MIGGCLRIHTDEGWLASLTAMGQEERFVWADATCVGGARMAFWGADSFGCGEILMNPGPECLFSLGSSCTVFFSVNFQSGNGR